LVDVLLKIIISWIFFVLIFTTPFTVGKELNFPININAEFYDVVINNDGDVERVDKPLFLKQLGFDAYTFWDYNFYADDTTCEIKDFSLDIKYTFPRIILVGGNLERQHYYFNDYVSELIKHEYTHCAITTKKMHDIYLELTTNSHVPCKEKAEKVYILEQEIEEANILFDTYTNHGEIELEVSPFNEDDYYSHCVVN
jgi:hypothetical protein